MEFPDLTTSLIFAAICLTASVGLVHLSGFVPTQGEDQAPTKAVTKPMIFGGILLVFALTIVGLGLAIMQVGWAFGIVIAGCTFLVAPFLVEPLPTAIKDGAFGLGIFIVIAAVALGFGINQTWGA